MSRIVIVDYAMGNLRSVAKALEHVAPKASVCISNQAAEIDAADRVVLPGQGAMPDCMRFLHELGLEPPVRRALANKPLLGICIGQQMLFDLSHEGHVPCLGLMRGQVRRFPDPAPGAEGARLKVPHMGWNRVHQTRAHPLWAGVPEHSWFYFVHSYYVAPEAPELVAGESDYGQRFTCAVARDNIFATQFHPEKSAAAGLKIFENFTHWNP